MTKEQFVAIATEEGLTRKEAELVWDHRPEDIDAETMTVEKVRATTRSALPEIKLVRFMRKLHDDLEC